MAQNVYDREDFFEGYSRLPRSVEGLNAAPEWGRIMSRLPDCNGLDVLDLGCGFGWFCRWAAAKGASTVDGVDISENMLARARDEADDARIRYQRANLETVELGEQAYDLVYSSLALHYIVAFRPLIERVAGALRPGGLFVFTMEHPMLTAPMRQDWVTAEDGRRSWPVNSYQMEGERVSDWLAPGVVKQHRSMATTLNTLIESGLTLRSIEEFCPDDVQIAEHPEWAEERDRPSFLLVSAGR